MLSKWGQVSPEVYEAFLFFLKTLDIAVVSMCNIYYNSKPNWLGT